MSFPTGINCMSICAQLQRGRHPVPCHGLSFKLQQLFGLKVTIETVRNDRENAHEYTRNVKATARGTSPKEVLTGRHKTLEVMSCAQKPFATHSGPLNQVSGCSLAQQRPDHIISHAVSFRRDFSFQRGVPSRLSLASEVRNYGILSEPI